MKHVKCYKEHATIQNNVCIGFLLLFSVAVLVVSVVVVVFDGVSFLSFLSLASARSVV